MEDFRSSSRSFIDDFFYVARRDRGTFRSYLKDGTKVCLRAKFAMFLISTAVNSDFTKSFHHRSKLRVMQLQNAIT